MTTTPQRRAGGRSARVREAVYDAVGAMIGEGAERITLPAVAGRAGVNPTTLYRRWGSADALLEEVAVAALTREGEAPVDTGSLEGDLMLWSRTIADDIMQVHRARYLRAMAAARGPALELCGVRERRREQAASVIDRARGRGEPTPTVEQVLDHVIAPLYHHVVFALPVDDDFAERLVRDTLLMVRD